MYFIYLSLIGLIVSYFVKDYISKVIDENLYRIRRINKNVKLSTAFDFVEMSKLLSSLSNQIMCNMSVYNSKDIDENIYLSRGITLVGLVVFFLVSVAVLLMTKVWYLGLFYLITILLFISLFLVTFTTASKTKFITYLPVLFKKTFDRINDFGNVEELLEYSLNDFEPTLQVQIRRILNALKLNNRRKVEYEINKIKMVFNNHLFTIYLTLVVEAKFNGLNEEVIEQFRLQTRKVNLRTTYSKKMNKLVSSINIKNVLFFLITFTYLRKIVGNMYLDLTGNNIDFYDLKIQLIFVVIILILLISMTHLSILRRME